jgi:hypothetical protein
MTDFQYPVIAVKPRAGTQFDLKQMALKQVEDKMSNDNFNYIMKYHRHIYGKMVEIANIVNNFNTTITNILGDDIPIANEFGAGGQAGVSPYGSRIDHWHYTPKVAVNVMNIYQPSTEIPSGATTTPYILPPGTTIGNPISIPSYVVPVGGTNVPVGTTFTPGSLFPSGFVVVDPHGYDIPGGTEIIPTDPADPAYIIPIKPTDGYGSFIYVPEGTVLPGDIFTPPDVNYDPKMIMDDELPCLIEVLG